MTDKRTRMDHPHSYNGAYQRLARSEFWLAQAKKKQLKAQDEVDKRQREVDFWKGELETITKILEGKV